MIDLGEAVTADNETRQAMKDAIVDVVGGSGAVVVDVRFVEDGQGGVVSVVVDVVCGNDGAATVVVDTVEQRLKGDDCAAGVLCRPASVRFERLIVSDSAHKPATCGVLLLLVTLVQLLLC